jgi:ferredoxin
MILIRAERCDGCGACIEVCPEGAIYLVDGRAAIDRSLCRECESCIAVCPTDAITYATQASMPEGDAAADAVLVPVPRPEPAVIRVKTQPAPVPLRAKVLPVLGAALVWAGRELVPRLADYALYSLDRLADGRWTAGTQQTSPDNRTVDRRGGGAGRRRRRRRRGG